MFHISYTPDVRHWRLILRVSNQGRTTMLRTVGLTLVAGALIASLAHFAAWPVAAAGALVFVLPDALMWLTLRRLPPKLAFGQRDVRLSNDGVEVSTRETRFSCSWAVISDVVECKDGWVLIVESQPCALIPRDVVSEEQVKVLTQFIDTVKATQADVSRVPSS